jgi:DNA-binding response OmpR family regulator
MRVLVVEDLAIPARTIGVGLRREGMAVDVVLDEELLERVWGEAADPFTTAVKTTIRRLRGKLGDPPVVYPVREGGYRIGEQ